MKPRNHRWALSLAFGRSERFIREIDRGQMRGRSDAEVAQLVGVRRQAMDLLVTFHTFDMDLVDLRPVAGAADEMDADLVIRCLWCGSLEVDHPAGAKEQCRCARCGAELGPLEVITVLGEWLLQEQFIAAQEQARRALNRAARPIGS